MSSPLLRVSRLSKAFAAPVLKAIDFDLAAGEVVALTGENGAGKSTLSKIIAGLVAPDSGAMTLHGEPFAPRARAEAERCGVRMVLQELGLIGTLSIAENLQMGQIPARAGFIRRAELHRIAREQLARVGLADVDPALPVSSLGIGRQQLVEIARGLMGEARVLILDEPTAMLTAREIEQLFAQIARLKAQGVGLIYISHRLDELSRIADRIVVLRDGALVVDQPARALGHNEIVRAMIGHDPRQDAQRARRTTGAEMLRIAGLTLYAGEIVGLAGLVGSGRTRLLRSLFASPTHAVAQGIGLVPEDRKAQGLLLTQSIAMNLTLANLPAVSRLGFVQSARQRRAVEKWAQRLRIRARDGEQTVGELSGGNQQKVLLARWLHRECRVLLLDEPTRGVDIGAREDIYTELDELAAAGKALLVVSSDLRELTMLCDRIAVMSAGKLVRVFERGEWTEQALLEAAFSAYTKQQNMA